ncbi:MAG: hypothetical protein K6G81_10705 [Lachnospiraceae bacterium]|nr:hypothetical protein [Lachnospiraceae bacterium]
MIKKTLSIILIAALLAAPMTGDVLVLSGDNRTYADTYAAPFNTKHEEKPQKEISVVTGRSSGHSTAKVGREISVLPSASEYFTYVARKTEPEPSATVITANTFDYFTDSLTGLSDRQLSKKQLTAKIADYGSFTGLMGMPVEEYREAMEYKWADVTSYGHRIKDVNIDISRSYTYDDLVSFLKLLSRRPGVYLYDIGETTSGRRMYALEIDMRPEDMINEEDEEDDTKEDDTGLSMASSAGTDKTVVLLTGNIHARETAGSVYVLKELADLLQSDTDEAKNILNRFKIAAVVCVNPDGRDGVAFDRENYTYSNGVLWKATSNGTDLNRNFPGLAWSQVLTGNSKSYYISNSANKIYYPGDYAGCNKETKAMMKFLYHYIVLEKATVLLDYHQQGRISYAAKPWQTTKQQKRCKDLANALMSGLNKGNSHKYTWYPEDSDYDLNGTGSTLTDYAVSLAVGAKFSPAFGFCVFTDGINEYPLISIPRLNDTNLDVIHETNPDFATMTFEIGYGSKYLGYTSAARKLLAEEYDNYHFDRVLYNLYDYLF